MRIFTVKMYRWQSLGLVFPTLGVFKILVLEGKMVIPTRFQQNHPPTPVEETNGNESSPLGSRCSGSPVNRTISSVSNSCLFDRIATWPEERLLLLVRTAVLVLVWTSPMGLSKTGQPGGIVIVTAGLRGEIRTFQNFGLPASGMLESNSSGEDLEASDTANSNSDD
ncbi:putative WD repeat-containing protein 44-like [Forsythia ovata]|uniref:WD repeat-containing protein 44-like n=1 Tax=Forsythia ovata TaxID=205694 RepID=A0ABD1T785_9LAMI